MATLVAGTAACTSSKANHARTARSAGSGGPPTTQPAATLHAALAPWKLPAPVSREALVTDGANLLVAGGLVTGDVSTTTIVQIVAATGASTKAGVLASAVHDMGGALLGGQLFVFGGGGATTVATVQRFTEGKASAAGSLPQPRSDAQVASQGGTAWIIGGFDGKTMDADVLATTDGATFKAVGTLAVPVRYPAVTWAAGAVWVVGGQLGTSESTKTGGQSDAIQRFDPASGKTVVVGHLPVTLGHASAVALGGVIWVVGGQAGTAPTDKIYRVDPATGAATEAGVLPGPRSDGAVAVIDGTAYLVGGETTDPAHPLDSVVLLRTVP